MTPRGVVLIADDEEMNKVLLARRLHREGFVTVKASDGHEVLDLLRNCEPGQRPHMILMDVHMPIMDGIETTRIVKQEFSGLPVIAVTAGVVNPVEISDQGFDDVCSKPIDFKELILKIQKLLPKSG